MAGLEVASEVVGRSRFAALAGSSRTVRWGGTLVAFGGVMFILASFASLAWMVGWIPPLSPGYEMYAEAYRSKRIMNMALALTGPVAGLLVSAGLLGVCALVGKRSGGLAQTGAAIAFAAALISALLTVQDFMPRYVVSDPSRLTTIQSAHALASLAWLAGILLVGACALRARSLGRWRFLPALLAPLCFPARQAALFLSEPPGSRLLLEPASFLAALLEAPRALGGAGWFVFGLVLAGAWQREARIEEKEALTTARRFYEEAWNGGELEAVDELLDAGFVDRRHGREGREPFKGYLADLRATFPDLRFEVREQTFDEHTVTTRWRMSGTDRGGLLYYPPTNKSVSFTGVFFDRIEEGRILEHAGYVDEESLFEQLGLEIPGVGSRE